MAANTKPGFPFTYIVARKAGQSKTRNLPPATSTGTLGLYLAKGKNRARVVLAYSCLAT